MGAVLLLCELTTLSLNPSSLSILAAPTYTLRMQNKAFGVRSSLLGDGTEERSLWVKVCATSFHSAWGPRDNQPMCVKAWTARWRAGFSAVERTMDQEGDWTGATWGKEERTRHLEGETEEGRLVFSWLRSTKRLCWSKHMSGLRQTDAYRPVAEMSRKLSSADFIKLFPAGEGAWSIPGKDAHTNPKMKDGPPMWQVATTSLQNTCISLQAITLSGN